MLKRLISIIKYIPFSTSISKIKRLRMFDSTFYLIKYPDIKQNNLNPFLHYVNYGYKEGRHPHPLFDPIYYKQQIKPNINIDPFLHYLKTKGQGISPHPLFNYDYYSSNVALDTARMSALEYYVLHNKKHNKSPSPLFNWEYYSKENPDVVQENMDLMIHYIMYGESENRNPNPDLVTTNLAKRQKLPNENYMTYFGKTKIELIASKATTQKQLAELKKFIDAGQKENYVIFISHEATRTGAPLIILEIAKNIKSRFNLQPIFILLKGGDIINDFKALGQTLTINGNSPQEIENVCRAALSIIKKETIAASFVNSAESRHALIPLAEQKIVTLSLIHEMANLYNEGDWDKINNLSYKTIFPAKIVSELAIKYNNFNPHDIIVRGQGLLKPNLLSQQKDPARFKLRKKLNLSPESKIILGCGSRILRKGIDLFISIAISCLNQNKKESIFFIWLGGESDNSSEILEWAKRDIELINFESNIIFLPHSNTTDIEFLGSDIFLMTSRADPYPCVVHEAMAAELPVVCFEGGGGFTELVVDGDNGRIVPFRDITEAVRAINYYLTHESERKNAGNQARKLIKEFHDFTDYVNDLISLLPTKLQKNYFKPKLDNYHSKIQIIFTLPDWWISGVNTFVENLIENLIDLGFDAYILFTSTSAKININQTNRPSVPYKFLQIDSINSETEILMVLKAYLELHAPCIFVPNYDYLSSSLSPSLPTDVGILGVLHSDDNEHYEHAYRLGLYWNKIISVSKTIEQRLLTYNASFKGKSKVIYYGINDKIINKYKSKRYSIFTIVYTGRIVQEQKRILDFVPIIEGLSKKGIPFQFIFIGTGPDEDLLKRRLDHFIKSGAVIFYGKQSMEVIYQILNKAHVFALCSEFEGLPLSLLEAMAAGCVPILTNIKSGISELMIHNNNALLSDIGDTDSFVNNVLTLYKDEELYKKIQHESIKTIHQKGLTSAEMSQSYVAVIEEIITEIARGKTDRKPLIFQSGTGSIILPQKYSKLES